MTQPRSLWLGQPFGRRDLSALRQAAARVPGFDSAATELIGVSRAGFTDAETVDLALRWEPEDVIAAFASPS